MTRLSVSTAVLALALLAACGGDSAGSSSTTPTTAIASATAEKTSFAADFGDEMPDETATADYTDYTLITDDSGTIQVSVPTEWTDVDGSRWTRDGVDIGAALSVAPNLAAWNGTWGTPGLFIAASASLGQTPTEILDGRSFAGPCDYVDRYDFGDGLDTGFFDYYENCGNEDSTFIIVAAQPPDGSFAILVEIVVVTDRDLAAADEVINTFQVIGALN